MAFSIYQLNLPGKTEPYREATDMVKIGERIGNGKKKKKTLVTNSFRNSLSEFGTTCQASPCVLSGHTNLCLSICNTIEIFGMFGQTSPSRLDRLRGIFLTFLYSSNTNRDPPSLTSPLVCSRAGKTTW